jgi:hypothetical protein
MDAPIITSARKTSLDTERGFALRSTSAAGFAAAGFVSVMNRSFAPPRIVRFESHSAPDGKPKHRVKRFTKRLFRGKLPLSRFL